MKILITGGAGFIGSHIAQAYLDAGHEVCIVDDLSSGSAANVPHGSKFYKQDIRKPGLAEIFEREKPHVVNHQAARANVRESFEAPLLYADVNVLGSVNVLECCRLNGVSKVVYASTGGAVYGEPHWLPVTEDHPINPLDPYGASKHHVEHYLYLYRAHFGISYVALRYPNVYGEGQNPYGEAGVVAIFASKMILDEVPVINGNGEQERDFVHVSDVARASVLALEGGQGDVLNIGSGTGTSVNTIAEMLCQMVGYKGRIGNGPPKKGEVQKIYLEARRAREVLGWEPRVALRDGLAATVRHLKTKALTKQVN
jgi:UDP-glucose 4-epimerase